MLAEKSSTASFAATTDPVHDADFYRTSGPGQTRSRRDGQRCPGEQELSAAQSLQYGHALLRSCFLTIVRQAGSVDKLPQTFWSASAAVDSIRRSDSIASK
jgi:hypothetical protein